MSVLPFLARVGGGASKFSDIRTFHTAKDQLIGSTFLFGDADQSQTERIACSTTGKEDNNRQSFQHGGSCKRWKVERRARRCKEQTCGIMKASILPCVLPFSPTLRNGPRLSRGRRLIVKTKNGEYSICRTRVGGPPVEEEEEEGVLHGTWTSLCVSSVWPM